MLWLFFIIAGIVLGLVLLERWRTEKKMFIFLQPIAKRLGLDEIQRLKGLDRDLSTGVTLNGRWNGIKVTLDLSSVSNGIEILLELDCPRSARLRIRRARKFYNVDLIDLLTRSAPKVKFKTATNDDFEISSDNPSSAMQLINLSVIKQRLPFCIQNNDDLLQIDETGILLKASSPTFLGTVDWEEIEEKLIQMWFLATSISSLDLANVKVDINLLKCPYCRGMLNEGVKIVRCNSCHTMFHESCWSENGECAIFQCDGATSEAIQVKANNHVQ